MVFPGSSSAPTWLQTATSILQKCFPLQLSFRSSPSPSVPIAPFDLFAPEFMWRCWATGFLCVSILALHIYFAFDILGTRKFQEDVTDALGQLQRDLHSLANVVERLAKQVKMSDAGALEATPANVASAGTEKALGNVTKIEVSASVQTGNGHCETGISNKMASGSKPASKDTLGPAAAEAKLPGDDDTDSEGSLPGLLTPSSETEESTDEIGSRVPGSWEVWGMREPPTIKIVEKVKSVPRKKVRFASEIATGYSAEYITAPSKTEASEEESRPSRPYFGGLGRIDDISKKTEKGKSASIKRVRFASAIEIVEGSPKAGKPLRGIRREAPVVPFLLDLEGRLWEEQNQQAWRDRPWKLGRCGEKGPF